MLLDLLLHVDAFEKAIDPGIGQDLAIEAFDGGFDGRSTAESLVECGGLAHRQPSFDLPALLLAIGCLADRFLPGLLGLNLALSPVEHVPKGRERRLHPLFALLLGEVVTSERERLWNL